MSAYYNEIDKDAAAQLRAYIAAGLIAPGVVDERSIEDIAPNELLGYTQLHFFAGVGGWSYALDLAGWPRGLPVITGSCPCQPFSQAGAGAGFADERHLWPAFWHIIRELHRLGHPAAEFVFGEQVASPDALRWLDLVFDDLESEGYACWAEDSCSASVGAPHIRQRLCWMAYTSGAGYSQQPGRWIEPSGLAATVLARRLADPNGRNPSAEREQRGGEQRQQPQDDGAVRLADAELVGIRGEGPGPTASTPSRVQGAHGERKWIRIDAGAGGSAVGGFWSDAEWIWCRDEKYRPVEPGSFPLAHGLPRSMGALGPELLELARVAGLSQQSLAEAKRYRVRQLKGYGNAINPWQAAEFVRATMDRLAPSAQQAAA